MNMRTVDSILEWFEEAVAERQVVTPSQWVDAGLLLNALMGEEHAKLAELEHQVSVIQLQHLGEGKSAAYAKVAVKATDSYRDFTIQKMKCERVVEFIRLAKKRAQMASDEIGL